MKVLPLLPLLRSTSWHPEQLQQLGTGGLGEQLLQAVQRSSPSRHHVSHYISGKIVSYLYIIVVAVVLTINTNPSDGTIVILSREISSVESSVECSTQEQASLQGTATSLETAVRTITTALSAVLVNINGRYRDFGPLLMSFSYRADRVNSIF